jgi:hypothetical protein
MANDGSYKSNNDVESPPSTLEKLLIESISSNRATNPGANARHQPTDAIYGSKTLIMKEKE